MKNLLKKIFGFDKADVPTRLQPIVLEAEAVVETPPAEVVVPATGKARRAKPKKANAEA